MDLDQLVHRHPRLFHMAAAGTWPSVREHGLLPTRTIVTTSGLPAPEQEQLLGHRRVSSTTVEHPRLGRVVLRDQGPLRLDLLERRLTDMTVPQWLDVLNDRVFFWPDERRLDGLLAARRYRGSEHTVITLDTAGLVRAHEPNVRLSTINSGATLYPNAPPRGSQTFLRLSEHPAHGGRPLAELVVIGGVVDVAAHVVRVERRRGGEVLGVLHERDRP